MRLIDADALCEYANNQIDKTVDANDIMRFPRVDAVPVVRCRECKFLHLSSLEKWCWNEDSICYAGKVTDNWYCADGKQKEDAK